MTNPEDALRDLAAASASGDEPIEVEPIEEDLVEVEPIDESPSGRPESPLSQRPEAPPTVEHDVSEMSANALAQLSGTQSAAYDPSTRSTSRRKRIPKPDVGMITFRTAAIPVLITVGLVMIALGVWGIMVKGGNTTLPMADQPNAQQLAMLGLVGLPIGLLLFASAGFFFFTVRKDKEKLARWEAAHEHDHGH